MCINIPGGDTFGIELSPKLRVGRCKDRSLRLGGGGGCEGSHSNFQAKSAIPMGEILTCA